MSDCEVEEEEACGSPTSCVQIILLCDVDAVEAGERDKDRNADTFGSLYDLPDNADVSLCFFSVGAPATTTSFDTDDSSVLQFSPSSVEGDVVDDPKEKKGGRNDPGNEAYADMLKRHEADVVLLLILLMPLMVGRLAAVQHLVLRCWNLWRCEGSSLPVLSCSSPML